MSRDIVDISSLSKRLVVAAWIESEPPDQLARSKVEDADVAVCDQQLDRLALVGTAEADVAKLAVVAQGDLALGIDLVAADAEVGLGAG